MCRIPLLFLLLLPIAIIFNAAGRCK